MKYTLGTVCKLKEIDLEIIIIGYNGKSSSNNYVYEYVGCLLNEGFTTSEKLYRFNSEHIDTVLYEGYNKNQNNNSIIETPINNNINQEVKTENTSNNNTIEEEYIFDENGVLVEIRRPKQEVAENQPTSQASSSPVVTLENIDINNI